MDVKLSELGDRGFNIGDPNGVGFRSLTHVVEIAYPARFG